jgi:hypothetical protein
MGVDQAAMCAPQRRSFRRAVLAAFLVLAPLVTTAASAQERPSPTLDLSAGWVGFADDGVVSEGMLGGSGLFQTRESFFGEDFTQTEGAFTTGGGMRAAVGNRVTVGVDARIGWETHVRINGVMGVRLGR